MSRKQPKWSKENPIAGQARKILEDFYQSGLVLLSDLRADKCSAGQADSAIFAWQNGLQSALFMVDQGVLSGFSIYRFIVPPSVESLDNYVTRGPEDTRLAKMLRVIEGLLDGTFEPKYPIRDSVSLAYDGKILFDQFDPHMNISPRKASLPYKILRAFYKDPSKKRIAQREISTSFDVDAYIAWVSHLGKSFHCTKLAIENVIFRDKGFVNVTEKFKIIEPL